jgi:hypothetical protein
LILCNGFISDVQFNQSESGSSWPAKIAGFGAFGFDGTSGPIDGLGRQPLALEF